MCYIFNCFGWTLDLIQRFITFFLTCCLCYAIGVGLAVALVAGIAYGYNYSMAEFLTFTRSDVTVYMKRGQFYDRPDILRDGRKAGGGDINMIESQVPNTGIDYNDLRRNAEDVKPAPESLSGSLQKAQDTRSYAEKLARYEYKPKPAQQALEMSDEGVQAEEFTEPIITTTPQIELMQPQVYNKPTSSQIMPFVWTNSPSTPIIPSYQTITPRISYRANTPSTVLYKITRTRKKLYRTNMPGTRLYQTSTPISITPNLAISTVVFRSGSSPIVMRNFKPIQVVEMPRSFEDFISRTDDDNVGKMELVDNPDNFRPLYFKKIDTSSLPRTLIVNRYRPAEEPPTRESELSQEYEESATRVHRGPSQNYPMEEYQ